MEWCRDPGVFLLWSCIPEASQSSIRSPVSSWQMRDEGRWNHIGDWGKGLGVAHITFTDILGTDCSHMAPGSRGGARSCAQEGKEEGLGGYMAFLLSQLVRCVWLWRNRKRFSTMYQMLEILSEFFKNCLSEAEYNPGFGDLWHFRNRPDSPPTITLLCYM